MDITVHCNPPNINKIGANEIYCIVSDSFGNSAKTSFTVTVPLDVMFVLEPITTDSCEVRVQIGTTVPFSLESCDSEYADISYSFIPRSMYYGNVEISSDGMALFITAPESVDSNQTNDEFGVTINYTAYNQPRVDVAVIYYE